jgi:NADH dehydrogenase
VVDGDRVLEGAWTAGDCAQVPDLTNPGAYCSPSAQHAVRQAAVLAFNIRQAILGGPLKTYKHKYAGSVASLGLHKGVAQVYGIKLKGLPAWFMHRTYHVSRIPSLNRKVRVVADWTLAFLFKRETVSLGQLHEPREEFTHVTPPLADERAPEPVGARVP